MTRRATLARLAVPLLLTIGFACGDDSGDDSGDAGGSARDATRPAAEAIVDYVVDGDTIDVELDGDRQRVRLIGIDTPETKKPNTPVECFGPQATDFTRSLLPEGTPVRLERDVVGRDDFGRLLAYVYRTDDGVMVNLEIVRQGYAQPLTIPPNVTFAEQFVAAARAAEAADLGLWSACAG